ncbi:hypothetical protein P8935_13780 [Telmatobacter sp. DSM 110680]|uniref:Uncharacterized protein n=1 Tax=Telmatobacter sp. DSM 110680 TaxID=3036704 RepID=A0AAU7DE83_9BACT
MESTTANEVVPPGARYTLYPVIGMLDPLGALQVSSTSCGLPVPLRDTVKVGFVGELLLMDNWPVYEPATPGSNCTLSVRDCPGLSVAGSVVPDTEKPLPLTFTELTVTGEVPVELKTTGCDTGVFNRTLPNDSELPFTLRAAVPVEGASVMLKVVDRPPNWAVITAAWFVATLATFALNPALVAPALTVTSLGTTTAGLLLVRATWNLLMAGDVR